MSKVKSIFIGPDGLRHGWRFLIFVAAIVLVVQFLEQPAIALLEARLHVDRSALSAPSIILGDGLDLIVILIVTGGMRIHCIALRGTDLISSPLLWLVGMLLVGVTEEYFSAVTRCSPSGVALVSGPQR